MNSHEVKERLLSRIDDLVIMLLPNGKRMSNYWRVGSVAGEPGESLGVCLSGAKRGVWMEGAGAESGDVFQLWMAVKQCSFKDALSGAKSFLGITEPSMARKPPRKEYKRPEHPPVRPIIDTGTRDWARGRFLTKPVVDDYGVFVRDGKVNFHYRSEIGELEFVKYIGVEPLPSGKKDVATTPSPKPILFGMHAKIVRESTGTIVITEGEVDAMTYAVAGFPAVSIPFGAKAISSDGSCAHDEWIDNCWEWLEQFHTIYVSQDMDPKGEESRDAIMQRLGRARCRAVTLPLKDANEMAKAGRIGELAECIKTAASIDPDGFRAATSMEEAIWNRMDCGSPGKTGIQPFGWDIEFRIRPRESTIWTGHRSHGKTTFIRQLMGWLALRGEPVFVGSYEDPSDLYLSKMTAQMAGRYIKKHERLQHADTIRSRLWDNVIIHDSEGTTKTEKFFEVARYAHERCGIKHAVLDNLTCTDVNLEDKEQSDKFVKAAMTFWKSTGVHLHVVMHPRKPVQSSTIKTEQAPRVADIRGSAVFGDLFVNVATIFRSGDGSAKLIISKDREGGDWSEFEMGFDSESHRFYPDGEFPETYMPLSETQSTDGIDDRDIVT